MRESTFSNAKRGRSWHSSRMLFLQASVQVVSLTDCLAEQTFRGQGCDDAAGQFGPVDMAQYPILNMNPMYSFRCSPLQEGHYYSDRLSILK